MKACVLAFGLLLVGCGPPGGTSFVRAYASGDRAYSAGRYLEVAWWFVALQRVSAFRP